MENLMNTSHQQRQSILVILNGLDEEDKNFVDFVTSTITWHSDVTRDQVEMLANILNNKIVHLDELSYQDNIQQDDDMRRIISSLRMILSSHHRYSLQLLGIIN